MTLSARRKRINTILGLVLLLGLGFVFLPFVRGRGEMQKFCSSLQPGTNLSQVQAQAAARGYRVTEPVEGRAFVHEIRSFGRFNCDLRFGSDGLSSSAYTDNN
jgi:hypothetical protein